MAKLVLKVASGLALLWSIAIVEGVILNLNYAKPRAVGGQFDSFPLFVRIIYVAVLVLLIVEANILIFKDKSPKNVSVLFFGLNALSAIANVISRSPAERWNAIAALVLAYAWWARLRSTKGSLSNQ